MIVGSSSACRMSTHSLSHNTQSNSIGEGDGFQNSFNMVCRDTDTHASTKSTNITTPKPAIGGLSKAEADELEDEYIRRLEAQCGKYFFQYQDVANYIQIANFT